MNRRSAIIIALLLAPTILSLAAAPPPAPAPAAHSPAPATQDFEVQPTPTPRPGFGPGSLLLDGVELTIDTPFFPDAHFGATEPDNAIQVAAAIDDTDTY
ncbi:MAG: hypothetical protein E3J64_00965, partial [Anaerolineales bacterium]